MEKQIKHKIGLVFDGGGGKGAYQIGVWKLLKETGLDRYVTDIAGTSFIAPLLHLTTSLRKRWKR